ncbi:MAG TPA: SDR family oxidoreductase [Phototrophicaceae bacterium]|nr:SDR family oxidoreductase [Phototrophicaceae bacterium]
MQRILITGANRGIGLELAREYLQRPDTLIFATCRHPEQAAALRALAQSSRVIILSLDVTDRASIDAAIQQIAAQVDGLELLYNNAGIYPDGVFPQASRSSNFGYLEAEAMLEVFQVNTISPVIVTQAAASLLREGHSARVINLSSDAGSIGTRPDGGNYSYPASKAALNMMTRCLAADFRRDGVIVVSVHPGWIRTDMGSDQAPLAPEETIPSLIRVIDGLTRNDSGEFFNWDGKRIAW